MQKKKKLTIGLIVEDVFTDFAKDIVQSVVQAIPNNKNIEVVVIAGKFVDYSAHDDVQKQHKIVYNSIYRLEETCKFDGLLVALGSMAKVKKQVIDSRYLKKLSDIPKVFLVSDLEDAVVVNYDNESGIKEAVDYLVNVHNFSKFAMLGGRDDNVDAKRRKRLYVKCLKQKGITFSEDYYEPTDMSVNTREAADRLLNRCPDAEVIFCVNDAVAVGLYSEMKKRGLVPGKDIKVFGFDNTRMAGDMIPSLATIGAEEDTLGQKAVEILLNIINGEEAHSVKIPTRLYGRDSLDYELYEYTTLEMINVDENFIYRMFDECFYRYRYESIDEGGVNLRRLFFEFISKILLGLKNRYMSEEDFKETEELIEIFFANGALAYTDAAKLIKCIDRLQNAINEFQKSASVTVYINRLFIQFRNSTILELSKKMIKDSEKNSEEWVSLEKFLVDCTDFSRKGEDLIDLIVSNFGKLGLDNAAFFMFDSPAIFETGGAYLYPDEVKLRCYTKGGELFILPKERQKGLVSDIFRREELNSNGKGFIAFPIFFKDYIYGILVCQIKDDVAQKGEYIADQIGRTIYINRARESENTEREKITYNMIAEGLAAKYESVYYVNSANGNYVLYKANERFGNLEVSETGSGFFKEGSNKTRKHVHPEDLDEINLLMSKDNLIKILNSRERYSVEYRRLIRNKVHNMRLTVMWSSDKVHFVMGIEDINDEVEKEEEIERVITSERELARRDELTGVKNKNAYQEFEDQIQKRIDAKDGIMPFAILVADINNLKMINDTYGHKAGDEHIKTASKMICDVFVHSPVFRVGGDEFAVVLNGEDYFNREKLLKSLRAKILKNIKKPDGVVIATGMSEFDSRSDKSISNVFERADSKMYENKNFLKYI